MTNAAGGDTATAGPPASEDAATPSPPETAAAPEVVTGGLPGPLAGLAEGVYGAGDLAATEEVRVALRAADPADPGTAVEVDAATGVWQGTEVAVLSAGEDLTLAVAGDGGWQVVGGWWPSLGVDQAVPGGPRHVLVIGSDARPGEPVDGARADTLQVIGVDGQGGGGVMGIARDSWVTLSSGNEAKINAAMAVGGPTAQQQTVAEATGLPLEGYLLTGFADFTAMVNALGGVSIDAPVPVLDIPAGETTLDGEEALRYARERKTLPGGDFDRSRHQGVVLLGVAAMARLRGPESLPALLETVSPFVRTNLSAAQVLTLAASVHRVRPGLVGHEVATGGFGWSDDGQSIVLLDDAARDTFADFRDGNLR